MKKKNPYGYGLTAREFKALQWANEQSCEWASVGYFITGPDFGRLPKRPRGTPFGVVRGLHKKGMVVREKEWLEKQCADGEAIEIWRLTGEAIHVLIRTGGYRYGKQVFKSRYKYK